MIKLGKLTIEGFGSIAKSMTFNLDRPGLNILKGANGNGKTTLFSAMLWAAYKVNLKGLTNSSITTWKKYQPDGFRGTRVMLEFRKNDVDYLIARHINFKGETFGYKGASKLMVFELQGEDWALKEDQHNEDQQEVINELLEVDSKVFLSSVLFGQKMKRFIEASGEEKRKLLESLFNVDFVESAKDKAKIALGKKTIEISEGEAKILSNAEKRRIREEQIANHERMKENFEKSKNDAIAAIQAQLDEDRVGLKDKEKELKSITKELDKLVKDTAKLPDLRLEYNLLNKRMYDCQENVGIIEKRIKETQKQINICDENAARFMASVDDVKTHCPTCNEPLKAVDVKKAKESLKNQADKELEAKAVLLPKLEAHTLELKTAEDAKQKAHAELTKVVEELEGFNSQEGDREKKSRLFESTKTALEYIKKGIADKESRIAAKQLEEMEGIDVEAINAAICKMNEEDEAIRNKLMEVAAEVERLKWWVKAFGSSGIKSYVFSTMLQSLNVLLVKYAGGIGLTVTVGIDLEGASKTFENKVFRDGFEVGYEELSGGEQQRVNVCVAFALHDLIQAVTPFNVLIMDEVFENLDPEGIETVFELVRMKMEEGRSIYLITHSPIDAMNTKTVTVGKDKDKSSYYS